MLQFAIQRLRSRRGVTAIEYTLLAALIAVGITVAVTAVGKEIANVFTAVQTVLAGAIKP